MTMTKQHFITIADTLRAMKPAPTDERGRFTDGRQTQWLATVEAFADLCASENPRFDRMRWLAYVGNPDLK